MPAIPHELRLRVAAGEIDGQGHVNNVVYLRWVQEVAVAHWEALAPVDALGQIGWVARRHEIDYHAPALLGDELIVRTWVGQVEGLTFERHTEIRHAGTEKLLAKTRTLWIPIDPATGKPKRVSREVRRLFAIAAGEATVR